MSSSPLGPTRHSCVACGLEFSSPHKCEYHRRLTHQNVVSVVFNNGQLTTFERHQNGYFLCPECPNFRHQNPAMLQSHCKNHHADGFHRKPLQPIEQRRTMSQEPQTPAVVPKTPEPLPQQMTPAAPPNMFVTRKSIIPSFYYYILGVFEPAITIAGAINAILFQTHYLQGLSNAQITQITVLETAVLYQLGNMYFVLACVIAALWHVTQDIIILQLFEFVLALGDIGHIIATVSPFGITLLFRPLAWSTFVTSNIIISILLLGLRLAFLGNVLFNMPVAAIPTSRKVQ